MILNIMIIRVVSPSMTQIYVNRFFPMSNASSTTLRTSVRASTSNMLFFLIIVKDADIKALLDALPPSIRGELLEHKEAKRAGLCKALLSLYGGDDGCVSHYERSLSTINTAPRIGVRQ